MIQESNSTNVFFPDFNSVKDTKDAKDVKAVASKDDSYEQVMKKTLDGPKKDVAPKAKTEKAKVGNREPFFPAQNMPQHPQADAKAPVAKPIGVNAEMNVNQNQIETDSSDPEKSEELVQSVKQNFSPGMDISKLLREKDVDDQQGVLSQSFEASTATYPVSQIAAQSIDEETKKSLMEQGLWNQQGVYTAKPSAKLLAMMEMTENQKAVPVQKPIAQFMASMENELGVSPDRLVQAYSQLAPGSLSQSPQETMKEVLQKLDLSPADQKRAAQLYSKMLVQIQMMDSPSEQVAPGMMMAAPVAGSQLQGEEKPVKMVDSKAATQKYSQTMKSLESKSEDAASLQQPFAPDEQAQKVQATSGKSESGNFSQHLPKQMGEMESVVKSVKSQPEDVKVDSKGKLETAAVSTADVKHANVKGFEIPGTVAGAGEAQMLNGAADTKQARHEAIQSLINSTQALSHKGGGEMKLTLTPEHLGEIQVKVVTSGSNVDIQMVAEKSEAKKLIEQNIHELKAGLAQHGLSMDKLDVNIGDKSAGFQNQHGKPDFNQAREFAQQFSQSGSSGQRGREREELLASRMSDRSMLKSRTPSDALARRGVSSGRLNIVA